ncbi:fatty acid desaturase [Virgibacillus natechei]|uniref:Fatty acid desaturase n=1 Tax=Virgibacillus natechei TaxID=1216297 RepID=A0ABS4II89_9BACI|nr:hypothetical protein [Virgibacillus natechei]MBP1970166.1 fatty acid desaturase [Virgibacillus natechei]UZD12881.1 hypothetical protein OLD84_18670 [Virgibacillus natechei]
MEPIALKRMRTNQIVITNGLVLLFLILFFFIILIFDVSLSVLFLFLGVFLLLQAVIGLLKGESTKRFISIFEQVAIYEKQKMGKEWRKQRKTGYIWNFILSAFMFLQYYLHWNSEDVVFQLDYIFMFTVAITAIIVVNISLLLHFRKVDKATSESDLKGYTWKTYFLSIVIGVVLGFLLFFFLLVYIISTI